MNRTEAMIKVLETATKPMELDAFYEACQKLNPMDKGESSYRRNMWQIKDHVTKYEQSGKTYVKLTDMDIDSGSFATPKDSSTPEPSNNNETVSRAVSSSERPKGTVEFIDPDSENFVARYPGSDYIEVRDEYKLIMAHLTVAWEVPILLEGPKGVGKTMGIQHACWSKGIPLIQFDCSENMKRYDMIGRFILKGKGTAQYVLGVLGVAIQIANKLGHCALVLEEFNALSHNVQITLNQLTDFRRQVHIPELNATFRLADGCKLSIFATQNPSDYLGVNELNEAVRSRFVEYKMDYPDSISEQKIINGLSTSLAPVEIERVVRLANDTRAGVDSGEFSYALCPRDLVNFAHVFDRYAQLEGFNREKAKALAVQVAFVGRFDQITERDTFIKRAESTLNVELGVN